LRRSENRHHLQKTSYTTACAPGFSLTQPLSHSGVVNERQRNVEAKAIDSEQHDRQQDLVAQLRDFEDGHQLREHDETPLLPLT
jgi:hypothetical protein